MLRTLCLVFVASAAVAQASPKQKVAVLALRAEGDGAGPAANLLTEVITSELAHKEELEVLSSSDIATALGFERQKQLLGCSEAESCMAEIGSALGSQVLVSGSLGKLGGSFVLTVSAYDSAKAKVMGRETATVEKESELVPTAKAIVAKLFPSPAGVGLATRPAPLAVRPGWFVLIGAGALALAGGLAGAIALGNVDAFKMNTNNNGAAADARTASNIADGLFISAGVAGIVSVVLLLLPQNGSTGATP